MTVHRFFQGRSLPEKDVSLAGYATLIDRYYLQVPLPEKLAFISQHHRQYEIHDLAQNRKDDNFAPVPKDLPHLHFFRFALNHNAIDTMVFEFAFELCCP